jgi:DUF2971 family protein
MNDRLPDTLYHYTSQDGLRGIITQRKIWASGIQHLNDPDEFTYAVDITISEIERYWKDSFANDLVFLDIIKDLLRGMAARKRDTNLLPLYVSSFSERGDIPRQWCLYFPPEGGFSLGFNYGKLYSCTHSIGIELSRCLYEEIEQRRRIAEFLDETRLAYEDGLTNAADKRSRVRVARLLARHFCTYSFPHLAPILKAPSWREERE